MLVVDGGGKHLPLEREDADDRFESSRGSEQMSRHRFCRADGHASSMIAEYRLDGLGFEFVVEWCGSAVGVHVSELAQRQSGIVDGSPHGPRCALTLGGRSGHMMGISRGSVTDDLGQNRSAAFPRVLELLQNQDSRALPITNPSRWESKGREARIGSSLRVD